MKRHFENLAGILFAMFVIFIMGTYFPIHFIYWKFWKK